MIFLIGLPASGKSYWGKLLSQEFGMPLAGVDELVSAEEGITIPEIFDQKGAEYFRDKECEILKQIIDTYPSNAIVACGGGTPVYHNNIATMKANGCVVYLDVELSMLYDRLKDDNTRPLIPSEENKLKRLQQLLEERKKIYNQADYILKTKDLTLPTFAKIIQQCIDQH